MENRISVSKAGAGVFVSMSVKYSRFLAFIAGMIAAENDQH